MPSHTIQPIQHHSSSFKNVIAVRAFKTVTVLLVITGSLVMLGADANRNAAAHSSTSTSRQVSKPDNTTVPLATMVGQMIMTGFRGRYPAQESIQSITKQLKAGQLGGVIFYAYNIVSPQQIKTLTSAFRELSLPLPPLLAIDQEGGRVQRLNKQKGFADFPSQEALQKHSLVKIRLLYNAMAAMLSRAGFNLNFAPVVDLAVHPDSPAIAAMNRSYARDPGKVTACSRVCLLAHRQKNIIPAVKHFPGHGSARGDTHLGFVDTTDTWLPEELAPYRLLIRENLIDMVMTAHIFNAKLDPEYPATLSQHCIRGLLRNKLGYSGVVITDDLEMGAIRNHYSFTNTIRLAIEAGNDILLFSGYKRKTPEIASRVHDTIMEFVQQGTISTNRIRQSYKRIRALKKRYIHSGQSNASNTSNTRPGKTGKSGKKNRPD